MIKSIQFLDTQKGYVSERIEKPLDPRQCRLSRRKNKSLDQAMEQYAKDLERYEQDPDAYSNPLLAKLLLDRKIEFSKDRVNVIFGPNGCGKTTILRALAGYTGTEDGFISLFSCSDFPISGDMEKSHKRLILERMGNECEIDWDGVPVYYENFESRNSHGHLGELTGSILQDEGEELAWHYSKKMISSGNKGIYILQKVINMMKNPKKTSELIGRVSSGSRLEDLKKLQSDYWLSFPKADSGEPYTLLLDELDKSFDIMNVYRYFVDVLPNMIKDLGIQIITVTHSPLVLSEAVSKNLNIIHLDEGYSLECKQLMEYIWKKN